MMPFPSSIPLRGFTGGSRLIPPVQVLSQEQAVLLESGTQLLLESGSALLEE